MTRFRKLNLNEARESFELINESTRKSLKGGTGGSSSGILNPEDDLGLYSFNRFADLSQDDPLRISVISASSSGWDVDGGELDEVYCYGTKPGSVDYGSYCMTHHIYYPRNKDCYECNYDNHNNDSYGNSYYGESYYGGNYCGGNYVDGGFVTGGGGSSGTGGNNAPSWTTMKNELDSLISKLEVKLDELKDALQQESFALIRSTVETAASYYEETVKFFEKNPSLLKDANNAISVLQKAAALVTDLNTNTMGWTDLFNIWLFQLGEWSGKDIPVLTFGAEDKTTKDLQQQEGVQQAFEKAQEQIKSGNLDVVSYQWHYGQDEFIDGMATGNTATSFLGTYTTSITVIDNGNGNYTLNYKVVNKTGWESGTRLRENRESIIPDKKREEGLMLGGTISQEWTWSETRQIE